MMPPSFDSWTIVFLIAAVQACFTAWVLWRWQRGQTYANRMLALLLVLFALTLLEYVLYWTRYLTLFPHMANISLGFSYIYGPLIWGYLRFIYTGKRFRAREAWLLAPFLFSVLTFSSFYFMDGAAKKTLLFGQVQIPGMSWMFRVEFWLRMAWMGAFALWNLFWVGRQPNVGETSRWAKRLALFYAVFVLAYYSYFILVKFPFFNNNWDYHISAVMTAMIYLIAYAGYVQPAVFQGFTFNEPGAPAKYRNSGLTPEASRSLLSNLQLLMREERLYHDAEISLDKLALRLGASKHHVSQVINEQLGTSFFDYINYLRVEEAKIMLAETTRSDFHVIEIAYSVGFNNKASFNAAFKKAVGMTPTEYRRSHGVSDQESGPAGAR